MGRLLNYKEGQQQHQQLSNTATTSTVKSTITAVKLQQTSII